MAIDSKAKGAKAEADLVKKLSAETGHIWKRIPLSGALDAAHGLKGDLYIPNEKNIYCIEVKHYADDHISSKILTDKNPQVLEWWKQTIREAKEISRKPLLMFKFDRSKWFVGFEDLPNGNYRTMNLEFEEHFFFVAKLDDWLINEKVKFIV